MVSFKFAFTHSAWATRTIMDVLETLPVPVVDQPVRGSYQSPLEILAHLVEVEESFLAAVRGNDPPPAITDYALDRSRWRLNALESGWQDALLMTAARDTVYIPWLEQRLDRDDVLLQVLLHSQQHRSELALLASMEGAEIPHTDYILMRTGWIGPSAS